jgi:hypothetical protein
MPLQNRIRPDGAAEAVAARGMLTGNRGILHDPATRTLTGRRWTSRAWIACALQFKGRRRAPMTTRSWTELFFLDEVTALAAGHRPCFECRRKEAAAFARAAAGGGARLAAPELDRLLHGERRLSAAAPPPPVSPPDLPGLPDGAMIESGGYFYALRNRRALPWTHHGYGAALALRDLARLPIMLVSPRTAVAALRSGYRPLWHASADR